MRNCSNVINLVFNKYTNFPVKNADRLRSAKDPLLLFRSIFSNQQIKDNHREKNTLKWISSTCEKYEYGHLGCWYIRSTVYNKRFLNWNKIFKKRRNYWQNFNLCNRSILYSPFYIGFWQGSFVWKCYVFNLSTFN